MRFARYVRASVLRNDRQAWRALEHTIAPA
jgi:hypothetical protein